MTLASLIPLAINVSMGLVVFSLALKAKAEDVGYLLREPGLLVRSIVSMNIVMPILAALVAAAFDLHPAIKIAIVALALSPVPPILPGKQIKAFGTTAYVVSLLFIAAVLSVVVVPLGIAILGWVFGLEQHVSMAGVMKAILITVLVPLLVGILVRQFAPDVADAVSRPASLIGGIMLVAAFLPVLFTAWPLIMSMVGNGTLLVLAVFAVVGLAVGHWLGGPDPDNHSVLAIATSTRHPGVALAIAGSLFPDQKAVLSVVLWHLIVGAVVCAPYIRWRQQEHRPGPLTEPHPTKAHGAHR
jgi:BASS family bile acid:Na+ symporter